ncbi:MAG: hypothetical protein QXU11_09360 [Thermoproteota archaeon]
MNDFEVVNIKDEHFEQIVKMIAKFGVQPELTILKTLRSSKSIWKRMRN